jgi:hypothetical protein
MRKIIEIKIVAIGSILLLAALPPEAGSASGSCYPKSACKADCEKTKREISKIHAKMRQGYRASEGAKMEAKLRELRKRRSEYCR